MVKGIRLQRSAASRQNIIITIIFVVIVVALVGLSNGNIAAALVPPLAVSALLALVYLPMRYTVTTFFIVVLLINSPGHNPMSGMWEGPLTLFGELFYSNLKNVTGIPGLSFNLVEAGLGLLVIVMTMRTILRNNIDRHLTYPAARPMKIAAFVSLGAMLFAMFFGAVRGGNIREAFFQTRVLFWIPFILMLCMRAFKTDRDIRRLGVGLIFISLAHILEGAYFYFIHVRPRGLDLQYIMTHFETVWFVLTMVVLLSTLLETLKLRALWNLILIGGIVMWGIVTNDRRLAYVSMAASLMVMFVFIQHGIRRWLIRAALATLPLSVAYVFIGMHSNAAIFAPVHNLTSVADDTDASNFCRNVENYDLILTLRKNPLVGTGWGHEYDEVIVSIVYEQFAYLYRPHNSMLALLAFTGAIGFYLIWIYLPIGAFLASRTYLTASTPLQRTTAMAAMCVVPIYMIQCYGDLGIEDVDTAIVMSAPLACVANLVMRTGGLEEPKSNAS